MTPKSKPSTFFSLGTRGSPLALAQALMVQSRLAEHMKVPLGAIEIVVLKTSGDRIQDRPLAEVGGKGLFTKELDEALLAGRIDLAVHSMKDVPTQLEAGMILAAVLEREDVRDRLICPSGYDLIDLPSGARVGTSSLRRAAQVLARRPDLVIVPFRGNVGTRLAKLERGEAEATILAAAGLNRLGMPDLGNPIASDDMLPAPAQGAIGITVRAHDLKACEAVSALNHEATWHAINCERAFLEMLDGSCRTPIAALAVLDQSTIHFRAELYSPDGTEHVAGACNAPLTEAIQRARELAVELRQKGGPALRAIFG